ncbi:MAG TPA: GAF domain-containing protein [Candidatus Eremiobacteraceae bacterium]
MTTSSDELHTTRLEETRVIELGMLRGRFVAAAIASLLILFLPWPGSALLRPVPVVLWFVFGVLAYRATMTATSIGRIRLASQLLVSYDVASALVLIYLYWSTVPAAWAGMLTIIVYAATREREIGAALTGVMATLMLFTGYIFHHTGTFGDVEAYNLIASVAYTWITVLMTTMLVRATIARTDMLVAKQSTLETAVASEGAKRADYEAQADTLRRVVELAVTLLRERELNALLDRVLAVTLRTFGFHCGAILVAQREREAYEYRTVSGYPELVAKRLLGREVSFAQVEIKLDRRFLIAPSVYYAPIERHTWHTDPDLCFNPEKATSQRTAPGAWHAADTIAVALTSSSGEVIGLLCPDEPEDGLVPSAATMRNVALFARLAAAAIENVHVFSHEQHRALALERRSTDAEALAEQRRRQADRLARILDVTAAIFSERDLDTMLRRILTVTLDTFGFSAGSIHTLEADRNMFVRRAALGYPGQVVGKETSADDMRRMMSARGKYRDTYYYVPMELNVGGGITRNEDLVVLPRIQPGDWHELDLLLFPILNSRGEMIGILSPDDPKNHLVPDDETVRTIEVFAQLAGLAVETARMRESVRQPTVNT